MLRLLVLLLILLNAVYFAWAQGMLRSYGAAPVEQRESRRMEQQIRPEAIRILPPEEGRRAVQVALTPPKPPECLQAGLFDEAQTESLRKMLESLLPPAAWTLETSVEPARWIIYMGKFPNAAALDRKRAELEKMKLKLEPLDNPELRLGLSLGHFETQARAQAALNALQKRGVRTARVVQEKAELKQSLLRIPAADEAMKPRLEELKLVLGDKSLRTCK